MGPTWAPLAGAPVDRDRTFGNHIEWPAGALAVQLGLLLSCGSDFHVPHATRRPGDWHLEREDLRPLWTRLGLGPLPGDTHAA